MYVLFINHGLSIAILTILCLVGSTVAYLSSALSSDEPSKTAFMLWLPCAGIALIAGYYSFGEQNDEVKSFAMAAYVILRGVALITVFITLAAFVANRPSNWRKAKKKYDEYSREGKHPCIVHALLRAPQAMPDTPPLVRKGMSILADGGRLVETHTTMSWSAYEEANDPWR